jgi:hypothetical protein
MGLEVNNCFPFGATFKNEWGYTSTPAVYIHSVDREKFTFSPVLLFNVSRG